MTEAAIFISISFICFLISFLNIRNSDRYAFARLIAIVSFLGVFLSYIVPKDLAYLVAMVWDCLVIYVGTTKNLGRYFPILLLYPVMMVAHFYQWSLQAAGSSEFYNTYAGILYGLNALQIMMLLGLSDRGWNFINKIRDRRGHSNDNGATHGIKSDLQQIK